MESHPELRGAVLSESISFALSLPDARHSLMTVAVNTQHRLVDQWAKLEADQSKVNQSRVDQSQSGRGETDQRVSPSPWKELRAVAAQLEAVALVALASPSTKLRRGALDLLRAVRSADRRDEFPRQLTVRAFDVIEESGDDVLRTLHQTSRCRLPLEGSAPLTVTSLAVASVKVRDAQTAWTCCWAELARLWRHFTAETTDLAWQWMCRRLPLVLPEENAKAPPSKEQDSNLLLFRNYVTFVCATITVAERISSFPLLTQSFHCFGRKEEELSHVCERVVSVDSPPSKVQLGCLSTHSHYGTGASESGLPRDIIRLLRALLSRIH